MPFLVDREKYVDFLILFDFLIWYLVMYKVYIRRFLFSWVFNYGKVPVPRFNLENVNSFSQKTLRNIAAAIKKLSSKDVE